MKKSRLIYWIVGILMAFGGVFLVRLLSTSFIGNQKIIVLVIGYTLSIGGLFIITLGRR